MVYNNIKTCSIIFINFIQPMLSESEVIMQIHSDYHMHSKYSGDSKNELEAIVQRAVELGLKEIAITDHGPKHDGYGIKKTDYWIIRKEIDLLKEKYPQISILLGLEANILGTDGEIDLDEDMREICDWVNAGYHFGSNLRHDLKIHLYNFLSRYFKGFYEKAKKLNTKAMVNAMTSNKINMITHPGAKGPIDINEVASVASQTETMLEINNSHGHLTVAEIEIAKKQGVKFVMCSDAHKIEKIGLVPKSIERALAAGLTAEDIYNALN